MGLLREKTSVIQEEEEEDDVVPEGERSEGDGAEEMKPEEHKPKTEAEIARETRRKRVSYHVFTNCVAFIFSLLLGRRYTWFHQTGIFVLCLLARSLPPQQRRLWFIPFMSGGLSLFLIVSKFSIVSGFPLA